MLIIQYTHLFQTIFGELISLESNNDIMGLAMFILGRLLWNPDIATGFRHPKVPHLYRDGNTQDNIAFNISLNCISIVSHTVVFMFLFNRS